MNRDWCILQMSGQRTLRVVRSLSSVGIAAYAPTTMWRQSRPRSRKYRDIEVAVLPTFAFAPYRDLPSLCAILSTPNLANQHPRFHLMQYQDNFCAVADTEIQRLRDYEATLAQKWEEFQRAERLAAKRTKRQKGAEVRKAYVLGQRVRAPDTPFAGITGEITAINDNGTLVLTFPGFSQTATLDSCYVEPIQLKVALPERGSAARAA